MRIALNENSSVGILRFEENCGRDSCQHKLEESPVKSKPDAPHCAWAVPTVAPTKRPVPTPIKIGTRPSDGMAMVYVPSGEFQMGSEDGDDDEKPVHTVMLNAYWIDQKEVTRSRTRARPWPWCWPAMLA